MADSLAVKEGEAASPAIQPDYREIGRSLGEQLRTKERKIGIIADWKMSEAVQSEISGLKEALEGSGSEIRWCIYRRKGQHIVERIKAEKRADTLCGVGCRSSGRTWRTGRKWKIQGAELYGVGYSLRTIALLDQGNIQGLIVPDGYEIGYRSVEEMVRRIGHKFYKMQGYTTEYKVFQKDSFSMDDDLERFYIPMNKKEKKNGNGIICYNREFGPCAVRVFRSVRQDRENSACGSNHLQSG